MMSFVVGFTCVGLVVCYFGLGVATAAVATKRGGDLGDLTIPWLMFWPMFCLWTVLLAALDAVLEVW